MPETLWITGLQASGKTTLLNFIKKRFPHCLTFDANELRRTLCADLGTTDDEVTEHIRRIANMCKLLNDQNQEVAVAVISRKKSDRLMARNIIGSDRFVEHFVDCPKGILEERQRKRGLSSEICRQKYEPTTDYEFSTSKGLVPYDMF